MNPFKENFSMLPLREKEVFWIFFCLSINVDIIAEMST